jgi:iron complex outermembrane recepter protein
MASTNTKARYVAAVVIAGLAQALPAAAQESEGIGEITVTALKRETTEQTTPIAMSVITPEEIGRNGIANLEDMASVAPSVNFARSNTSSIITIRGVSSRDTTEIGDPAVSVNIDGLYLQRSIGLNESVFDLERIEVLRGPQGTLYGRNSTGGTISFITAKPKTEFEASAAVGFGTYDLLTTEGVINVPLSERVQIRAAFQTRDREGYRDNGPALDADDSDTQGARVTLAFQPTDSFSGWVTAERISIGGVGPAVFGTPFVDEDPETEGVQVLHELPPLPDDADEWPLSPVNGYLDVVSTMFRASLDYDFGWANLVYLGGYRDLDYHGLIDLDGTESQQFYFQQNENPETWSHELRLVSSTDGPLEWIAGLYYFEDSNDLLTFFQTYDDDDPPANLFTFTYPVLDAESKAVFANLSYRVLDNLKFTVGGRYSRDEKERIGSLDFGTGVLDQNSSYSESQPTWLLGVDWQVTESSLVYAKYATGYKAGGFTDAAPYDAETLDSFAVGTKNRFLEDRLQVNAEAFFYDYKDQQVSQFIGTQTLIRNAGKSEMVGVEVDSQFFVTDTTRLELFVGWLDAEYKDFDPTPEAPGSGDELDGNVPPQAPELTLNAAIEQDFVIGQGTVTARLQSRYEDDSNFSFFNTNSTRQDSYTRTDLLVSYTPGDDEKWVVEGYVRNLEDEAVLTYAEEQGLYGNYIYQFADPRTAGVRFKINW